MGFRRTGQMVSLLKACSFNFFTYLSDLSSLYLIIFDELMLEHEAGMGFWQACYCFFILRHRPHRALASG